MSLIPNTVCRRCHREYPVYRGKCPYCGTKKPREVKRAVPESDSAVRGTAAASEAAESMKWQMLIGGILLICVIGAVIAIVSVNMSKRVKETESAEVAQAEIAQIAAETTAIPAPTAVPTPSPTPAPVVTSIAIYEQGGGQVDGADRGFMEVAGTRVQLVAQAYPLIENVEVTWSSTDESCATVDENGLVTVVGGYGTSCEIIASVGSVTARCPVWGR